MMRWIAMAVALLWATSATSQSLPITDQVTGAEGRNGFNRQLTAGDVGDVYLLTTAYTQMLIDFDRVAPFAGTLYVCNAADADVDDDGAVDAVAACEVVSDLGADVTKLRFSTAKPYLVLDIDTAGSSLLSVRGPDDVGGGDGVGASVSAVWPD